MKNPHFLIRQYVSFFALAFLLAVVAPAKSWAAPPQDRDTTRQELAGFDGFMDSHPEIAEQLRKDPSLINNREFVKNHSALEEFLRQHPGVREEITENPNAFMHGERRFERSEEMGRRGELATLDRFLDSHPELSEQLRKDPSLINNKQFLESHPALQEFLQQHSGVREQLAENPRVIMRQEERFDRHEDFRDRDRDRDFRDRGFRDDDVTRAELAKMDGFLDSHPEISEQLRKDPSLINNQQFAKDHPALQEFLQQHPGVREEFTENPRGFMRQEERFDRHEDFRELASLDRFLDDHPVIDEQLRKNPSLVDSKEFVANHPDLRQYLQEHPAIRQELRQNPNAFMRREERFDRFEAFRNDDNDVRRSLSSFHEFMGSHSDVAQQISKNPSLAQNEEFLENHTELQQFLKAHPEVQGQLRKNPEAFVRSAQQFSGSTTTKTQIDPKLKK